jgi:hypothetical protein
MQFLIRLVFCGVLVWAPIAARPQSGTGALNPQNEAARLPASFSQLPDEPVPQDRSLVDAELSGEPQDPLTKPAAGSSSTGNGQAGPQTQGTQTSTEKSQHDKAEEELKQQEKQRVMGVMASFNTTANKNAAPLSPGQKFKLFFKSATDPWPFLLAGAVAGIGQAENTTPEWGQGLKGYSKRFGAGYSDYFIGNFFGNAVLPSLLREDPRYFQKGTGSTISRILWAAGSTVWCKRDNGHWGPNYANVFGNLIGTAIGRAYYPPENRTVSSTISDGFTVSAEGVVGAEVIEFWPDMVRKHNRKKAEKQARQAAEKDARDAAKPAPQASPATPAPKN